MGYGPTIGFLKIWGVGGLVYWGKASNSCCNDDTCFAREDAHTGFINCDGGKALRSFNYSRQIFFLPLSNFILSESELDFRVVSGGITLVTCRLEKTLTQHP